MSAADELVEAVTERARQMAHQGRPLADPQRIDDVVWGIASGVAAFTRVLAERGLRIGYVCCDAHRPERCVEEACCVRCPTLREPATLIDLDQARRDAATATQDMDDHHRPLRG